MLERKVEAFLQRKQVDIGGKKILVGVSGGPDSLALLHFLWSCESKWNIKVYAAHLDHMFRGKESEDEARFVQHFCEVRNIPFEMKQIDVPRYMEETGLSAEIAARKCRYSFYKEVLDKYSIPFLALGHHGDDQIETILMRLTRGSTGKARGGIPFSRPFFQALIIRPFLCLSRGDIEEYCARHQLEPRLDPSNLEDLYTRNRFRNHVLPFLKQENPKVHEHFQRFSEELISDEMYLEQLAKEKMKQVIQKKTDGEIGININAFHCLPLPLQRRGIQLILNYLYKVKPSSLSAVHMEQIAALLKNPHPSGALDFPNGLKIIRSYETCLFIMNPIEEEKEYCFEISVPGETSLPNGDRVVCKFLSEEEDVMETDDVFVGYIEEESLPLIIRNRRDGDRIKVKGLEGTKKLKRIFMEKKIPVHKRNSWPVIADQFGRIIWVPGLRKSSLYRQKSKPGRRKFLISYIRNEQLGG